MKKNYNISDIERLIEKYDIGQFFSNVNLPFYIIQYEKGEFIQQANIPNDLFQIVVDGEVSIYYIKPNGEKYFLAQNKGFFKLGSFELVTGEVLQAYAEAVSDVTVLALSLKENRELLLQDNKLLRIIASEIAQIIISDMNYNAATSSLSERVINHMKYYCSDNILCGIEKTAFQLHCSDRQLQRVLNNLESNKIVKKCGKGTYQLL